eukprot:4857139-Ditylum_brightwellii.AAC.1
MTFREDELQQLDKIRIPRLLPKLGFNRYMKRAIVFGPAKYLGLGLVHLKGLHLAMQVETIVKHIQNKDKICQAAIAMIRWGQLTSGVRYSIMKNTRYIPPMEGAWLKNFRDKLHTIGGTLE